MPKIYILLFLLSAGSATFAQNYRGSVPAHLKLLTMKPQANLHPSFSPNGQSTQITVDYTDAEFLHYQLDGNGNYFLFGGVANTNLNYSNNTVGYGYLYARVDSLYDESTGLSYQKSDVSSITVDSFTVFVNHTDSSHTLNTFYAKIVSLNDSGYPTNNVIWEDSLSTDTSLGSFKPLMFRPGFTVPSNHYAYRFDFKGDIDLDTFNVLVGCHAPVSTDSLCKGFNICDSLSHFYPNSYGFLLQGFDRVLPTSTGGFLFEDCNGNDTFNVGIDGYGYLQDLYVISNITLNNLTGVKIQPNAINNLKIYPDPAQNQATISYSLLQGGKVSVLIADVTGKIVKQYPQQEQASGRNVLTADLSMLEQGFYFVHLLVNGKEVSVNKLSVSRN